MFKRSFCLIILILFVFLLIPTSFALNNNLTTLNQDNIDTDYLSDIEDNNEIHVDINGSDDNDGKINTPVATIKKAMDLSEDNSKIIVHEGIYKENNLNITKSLEINGQGHVVIDAENTSRIFTINTQTSDKVLLSGITFTNARAYQGGAIYILNAITTIDNCRFINNTADTEGGAIYWNGAHGTLTNTIIENNYARVGSGVQWGQVDTSVSFGEADYGNIINCTFDNNHILQDDDACIGLSIYSNRVTVANSRFINHRTNLNSSFEVLYINGDYGSVINCLFENNSMTLTGALGLDGNYAVVRGNTFINNTVSFPESFGGALGIQSETGTIHNNTFISNGGDECYGGAIYINIMEDHQFSFINVTNNVFKDNNGIYGGNIYANGQNCMLTLRIKNNSFNSSKSRVGAGIFIIDIYDPVYINDNKFMNLMADSASGIYSNDCILCISNNSMENCTSNDGNILSYGEIKGNLNLKFNDITAVYGELTNLTASLYDDMGNSIFTRDINFKVDNVAVTGKKGLNSILATFNDLGGHVIGGEYRFSSVNVQQGTLTVLNGANITVNDVTVYGRDVEIQVKVVDSFGVPISNAYVTVNLKGNDVLIITNESGIGKTNVNLDFGQYNLTAKYNSFARNFTVTVLSSIDASNLTRAYNSGADFYAKLFDKNGNPLNSKTIIFEINGVRYDVKTDANGFACLNTTFNPGFYNVIVNNVITNEKSSYSLNIVKRITDNSNVNMYYSAGSVYKVRVYDDDGNPVGAGKTVKITVNKKSQNLKTDKNGYASFKLNKLNAGSYTITALYNGVKVSNKIVIKPLLTAKNISKKKAKTIKFSAKLINNKGKPLKSKKIQFKIKNKSYKIMTNKKGIATVKLKNLKVGKYTITTKYGKLSIKNTIKIKK